MGFEDGKKEITELDEHGQELERLRKTDNPYANEDSPTELGYAVKEHMEELEADDMNPAVIPKYGDKHAIALLGGMTERRKSMTDLLTGLRRREALFQNVPKILKLYRPESELGKRGHKKGERRKPAEKNCSMLFLDFDDFKKVNDTYGQRAGDDALRAVADIIKKSVRETDFVHRHGGEEFVVFLPDTDIAAAEVAAEKIRKAVEEATIKIIDQLGREQNLKKTITIGCDQTRWNEYAELTEKEIIEKMVANADRAMKKAKKLGKNRVLVFNAEEFLENK